MAAVAETPKDLANAVLAATGLAVSAFVILSVVGIAIGMASELAAAAAGAG